MFEKKIQSVLKTHLTRHYEQHAPVGAGLTSEAEEKRQYAAINEESASNSDQGMGNDKGSMS